MGNGSSKSKKSQPLYRTRVKGKDAVKYWKTHKSIQRKVKNQYKDKETFEDDINKEEYDKMFLNVFNYILLYSIIIIIFIIFLIYHNKENITLKI